MIHYISWDEYNTIVDSIAVQLKTIKFDMIVGIARSGLIPGVHLSHLLEVRAFGSMGISRTESDQQNAMKRSALLEYCINLDEISGKEILLVDDIVGEGETIKMAKKELTARGANVISVALMVNLDNCKLDSPYDAADIIGRQVRGWVVFPWCESR